MGWNYLPIDRLPRIDDIVWCRLPHEEDLSIPGDKIRPALVRAFETDETSGRAILHMTGGRSLKRATTAALKAAFEFVDLFIEKPHEIRAVGLLRPTRFDLRAKK